MTVCAAPGDAGERIDKLLARGAPELSRSRIKGLILAGRVASGGATITDPSYRVKPGESFVISVPEPVPAVPRGQPMDLTVVHEDDALIVIDKPAGMVVHPAPGNPDRTLVNALIAHCGNSLSGIGGVLRPGIVHRLDKDTSGLMVAAKTDAAHGALSAQFASRSLSRVYLTHRGYPLIGDKLYGGARVPAFPRQALHAYKLAFDHPDGGKKMNFEIALPDDMRALIERLTII